MKVSTFTLESPDSDSRIYQNIEMSIINISKSEVNQIKYGVFCFDRNGIAVYGSPNEAEDVSLKPGESFDISCGGSMSSDSASESLNDVKMVCDVRLMSCKKYDLGIFDIPESDSASVSSLKEIDSNVLASPASIKVLREKSDGSNESRIAIDCYVSSKSSSHIEIIKLECVLLDSKGSKLEEAEGQEQLPPNLMTLVSSIFWVKKPKLKGAKLAIMLSVYEQVAHQRIEAISKPAS